MEQDNLYEMIRYLTYGTKLHIGVLFFNDYGNERCKLPPAHRIHSGTVCEVLKTRNKKSYKRCFACRNLAIRKTLKIKKPFIGLCINGICEYTHPVVIDDEVACMIYIGNILDEENGLRKISYQIGERQDLLETLEKNFSYEKCAAVGNLLEGYIRLLMEKYGQRNQKINPVVENIKSYIATNLEFDIDVSHVTRLFHYNKQYLGRIFKKVTGESIKEYIVRQRLEWAKKLLVTGNDAVIDIANKVGFNNVTYFNRQFKSRYRMTPTEYRKSSGS